MYKRNVSGTPLPDIKIITSLLPWIHSVKHANWANIGCESKQAILYRRIKLCRGGWFRHHGTGCSYLAPQSVTMAPVVPAWHLPLPDLAPNQDAMGPGRELEDETLLSRIGSCHRAITVNWECKCKYGTDFYPPLELPSYQVSYWYHLILASDLILDPISRIHPDPKTCNSSSQVFSQTLEISVCGQQCGQT